MQEYKPTVTVADGKFTRVWEERVEENLGDYARYARMNLIIRKQLEDELDVLKAVCESLNEYIAKNPTDVAKQVRNQFTQNADLKSKEVERQNALVEMIEQDAQLIKDASDINLFDYEEVKEEVTTEEVAETTENETGEGSN